MIIATGSAARMMRQIMHSTVVQGEERRGGIEGKEGEKKGDYFHAKTPSSGGCHVQFGPLVPPRDKYLDPL